MAGVQTPAPKLPGSLGVTAIVFMVVAAASPLTVVGGAAPLGFLLGNGVGFPTLFATSAVILVLFSVGLSAMAKHVAKPGAFFTYAWGIAQLGRQRAMLLSGFVRVEPVHRLLLGVRADHAVRDASPDPPDSPLDAVSTLWGTVGYRVVTPLESFLALTRVIPTTRAQAELPGSNAWELRVIGRVVF